MPEAPHEKAVEPPDQEPAQPTAPTGVETVKGRRSFARVRRELSEEELSSPAVQKLLIEDIEALERELAESRIYREQYHSADRKCAVLEERARTSNSFEILYGFCLTMGSAAIGSGASLWANQPFGVLSLAFGLLLVAGAIASKVKRR